MLTAGLLDDWMGGAARGVFMCVPVQLKKADYYDPKEERKTRLAL